MPGRRRAADGVVTHQDIAFDAGGTRLRGWLYRPESVRRPPLVVMMSHGLSGIVSMDLERFAKVFADGAGARNACADRHLVPHRLRPSYLR